VSEEPAAYPGGAPLADALAMLERVRTQLARAVRRSERLDWLARQVGEAAALVRAAWEEES
jgi:hypothetical protein